MGKTLFGGTTQQIFMGLAAALLFIMAIEASQLGFGGGFGFFGWDGSGNLGWHGASVRDDDGVITIRVSEQGCRIKLEQRGEVTISEDERDIASLSSDGRLQLEVRGCGDKFTVDAKGGATPAIAAQLGGQDVPWDETARTRFHDALQLIYETTGFDAAGRVDRLYNRGGAERVLEVAAKMRNDWGQRLFLQTLLGKESLTVDETVETWRLAGEKLGSDYELGQLIQEASHRQSGDPRVQEAVVAALRSLGSDYELRRALDFLLARGASPALVDQLLAVAADKISSDYEQAEFLIEVGKQLPAAEPLPPSFDRALDTINSDYELRRALDSLIRRDGLSRADLDRLLQVAAENLASDHEMTEFLIAVAGHQQKAEPWPPGLRRAIAEIGSDHDEKRVREAFGSSLEAMAPAVEQQTAAD